MILIYSSILHSLCYKKKKNVLSNKMFKLQQSFVHSPYLLIWLFTKKDAFLHRIYC